MNEEQNDSTPNPQHAGLAPNSPSLQCQRDEISRSINIRKNRKLKPITLEQVEAKATLIDAKRKLLANTIPDEDGPVFIKDLDQSKVVKVKQPVFYKTKPYTEIISSISRCYLQNSNLFKLNGDFLAKEGDIEL